MTKTFVKIDNNTLEITDTKTTRITRARLIDRRALIQRRKAKILADQAELQVAWDTLNA